MRDIDYFSELLMDNKTRSDFINDLPDHLRSSMKEVSNGYFGDVLQGYRGPPGLSNGASGDSSILHPSFGVQEIRFWHATSKKINFLPFYGTIAFGVARGVETLTGNSQWRSLYFDEATGAILKASEAMQRRLNNEQSIKLNQKAEALEKKKMYKEAFELYKEAFKLASVNYEHESLYEANMRNAQELLLANQMGDESQEAIELITTEKLS